MRQLKSEYPFPYIHSTLSEKYTKKIRTAQKRIRIFRTPVIPGCAYLQNPLLFLLARTFCPSQSSAHLLCLSQSSAPPPPGTLTHRDNSRPPGSRQLSGRRFEPANYQRQNLARTMKSRILKTPPTFLQTSYLFPFPFVFFIYRNFFLSRHPKKPLFKKTSA